MDDIRAKIKRRFSHKEPNVNFDEHDEADEETTKYINKEADEAEKDESNPHGKPGSLINRMITHGNKKTEDQIARENQEAASQTANSVPQAG